jgi:hypothetical protein
MEIDANGCAGVPSDNNGDARVSDQPQTHQHEFTEKERTLLQELEKATREKFPPSTSSISSIYASISSLRDKV